MRRWNSESNPNGIEGNVAGNSYYIYNNTVYNIINSGSNETAKGIAGDDDNTVYAKNNYVGLVDNTSNSNENCFDGTFAEETYNVSSDGTATGTGSQTGKSNYAAYFVSTTGGSENLEHVVSEQQRDQDCVPGTGAHT